MERKALKVTLGGNERFALAGGKVHRIDCAVAPPVDGSGGYVPTVERGEALGFKPCASCLKPKRASRKKAD